MRPVARVRWHTGLRSPAGLGDAEAAALRGRFEQLLHGSGQGVPAVSQTLSAPGLPSPSAGRSAGLDVPEAQSHEPACNAPADKRTAARHQDDMPEPMLPPIAAHDHGPRRDTARHAPPPVAADASCGATGATRAEQPATQTASATLLASNRPAPPSLASAPQAAAPAHHASAPERATHTGDRREAYVAEPTAVLPQSAPTVRPDVQPQPPRPAPRPLAARNERDGLPALVRDLVQAVVQLSRGREGQWRLTMALKPQVLEGALVALDAQPGRLHVGFACDSADARARLTAARDDLRLRLVEALSAARPVDVSVEVQQPAETATESHV